ncbi:MATE family efflux transporter [Rhizosaccharibacter radicis]|uniref:MATE family efflux transporter n=1 Tax=Rhizosaccharibacter radicis TaxID=2782605 RepID=A0ABT1VTK0_9PROT|nr:MATE family efflux transporter [Acetobacteraceae bacterium KSS12]
MLSSVTLDLPLARRFLFFVLPMMGSNILQGLSGTINNIFVGRMLGAHALAAAGLFFPVLFLLISLVVGLGSGGAVLIGQAWGAGDRVRVREVAGAAMGMTLLFGLAIAVLFTPVIGPLLHLFGVPPDVLPAASAYAAVMLGFMPFLFVFILLTFLIRGVGDTVTPLLALAVSVLVSLLLTPFLIRGIRLGGVGVPALGVAGAAWAAALSWVGTVAWLVRRLGRQDHALRIDRAFLAALRPDPRLLLLLFRLGFPAALQTGITALAEMALLGMVERHGAPAIAAYGAVNQVLAYVQYPAISIAITASILSAQAIGAGRTDRLAPIRHTAMMFNLAFTGGLVLLGYALSRPLVQLFITSPPVVELTVRVLRIVLFAVVAQGGGLVLAAQMRSSGTVLWPTLISVGSILLVEVPVAWAGHRVEGLEGIWLGFPACFLSILGFQAAYFRLVWLRRPVGTLLPPRPAAPIRTA